MLSLSPKVVVPEELVQLKKLSTEKLIVWIIGKSNESSVRLTREDIVLECWYVNPEKHSLRGYPQYLCSHSVLKRISDMRGKRGLLIGPGKLGYGLSDVAKTIYADLKALVFSDAVTEDRRRQTVDHSISAMDEAPYRRLRKTPAYEKLRTNHPEQIVETDLLYFYGINWHTKKSTVHSKIKNVDAVVKASAGKDPLLSEVHSLLNTKYAVARSLLLNGGGN